MRGTWRGNNLQSQEMKTPHFLFTSCFFILGVPRVNLVCWIWLIVSDLFMCRVNYLHWAKGYLLELDPFFWDTNDWLSSDSHWSTYNRLSSHLTEHATLSSMTVSVALISTLSLFGSHWHLLLSNITSCGKLPLTTRRYVAIRSGWNMWWSIIQWDCHKTISALVITRVELLMLSPYSRKYISLDTDWKMISIKEKGDGHIWLHSQWQFNRGRWL